MLNNNFQNNNLNKLDTLGKIQMQRDQELNMPSQIRSVNNAYDKLSDLEFGKKNSFGFWLV